MLYIIIINRIKDLAILVHLKCDLIPKMLFWAQFAKTQHSDTPGTH